LLKDKEIDINTALAIATVSESIINTAKVEVQYLKAIESNNKSLFIEGQKE
jgi:sporulation protein YlmC with PRC-barrel domain